MITKPPQAPQNTCGADPVATNLDSEDWLSKQRLIDAAPDLLEALRGLVYRAPDATGEVFDALWDAARAAIAKATGAA